MAEDSTEALESLISRTVQNGRKPAPVEQWEPQNCRDIGLAIAADGTWSYQGSAITRERLVQLFSSVLRKDEDGKTYLVTPVEKVLVNVADAHFMAVECASNGSGKSRVLTFRTNVGDLVEAGPDHPIHFNGAEEDGPLKPYLRVRGRLTALATRAVTYQLIEMAGPMMVGDVEVLALHSRGAVFPIAPMDRIEAMDE
ncbi:DUF1285 domain-containing protein [Notoacmeibacter sp. MSK16QG-6]|uniref:DUF1285 domain-containing protein n=1 Tax=Notoacmeibacter sp. MSK16QG-6 TaxID=2957982 RepID=UPI0020A12A1D|nr:DUF1285 domain-containing protein [Notoacmeibacter sp. MSK16QG-6]MCP1199895.1 DUF1285 domain-containing protein [Notoacmeibacter sp. MSK16QG-6]